MYPVLLMPDFPSLKRKPMIISGVLGFLKRGYSTGIVMLFMAACLWAWKFHNEADNLQEVVSEQSAIIEDYRNVVVPGLKGDISNLEFRMQRLQQEQALLLNSRDVRQRTEERITVFLTEDNNRPRDETTSIIDSPAIADRIDGLRDLITPRPPTDSGSTGLQTDDN